jgi:hypothetical protein
MGTAEATDKAVQSRARRISRLIMTAGVVGPSLGAIAGRIAGEGSIFRWPGPKTFLFCVTLTVAFAALPFYGLAVVTRQSVCKEGRLNAFWIGAFVGGLVASILGFAVLVSDLEDLFLITFCLWTIVISLSFAMLLGGVIGWKLGRAISWFRQRAA